MTTQEIAERLWANSVPEPNTGCRLWERSVRHHGYGQMSVNGRPVPTHRLAYELTYGPIPAGMSVCHRCDVTCCVNPDHLFLGTHKDNMTDAALKGRMAGRPGPRDEPATHCRRGHALSEVGVREHKYKTRDGRDTTHRTCKRCIEIIARERYR